MPPAKRVQAADRAERLLIEGILEGKYPPGSELPGERILCKTFGVARPALREALQRLRRDGWLEIQHGKSTKVINLTQGGTLSILTGMLTVDARLFGTFVPDVMEMWAVLAPDYTARAITKNAGGVANMAHGFQELEDGTEPTIHAMWQMHHILIELSENLVYALIYNSFADFYRRLARHYYRDVRQRAAAREFWLALHEAAQAGEASQGASLVQAQILNTYEYWKAAAGGEWPMADS